MVHATSDAERIDNRTDARVQGVGSPSSPDGSRLMTRVMAKGVALTQPKAKTPGRPRWTSMGRLLSTSGPG